MKPSIFVNVNVFELSQEGIEMIEHIREDGTTLRMAEIRDGHISLRIIVPAGYKLALVEDMP